MTNHIIDPKLSQDLMDLLDYYEVPHEEGALLWEAEKRGYWIYLSGPDEDRSVEQRWEVRAVPDRGDGIKTIQRGQTARIALARLFRWFVTEGAAT